MNRYIILVITILVIIIPAKTDTSIEGYDIVASSNEENIILYAKRMNNLYQDFKIEFKGGMLSRP